jgi:hypothetical protein
MSVASIADALQKAAGLTESEQRDLTVISKQRARTFSWEKAGQAYLDVFHEFAASRRRAKV